MSATSKRLLPLLCLLSAISVCASSAETQANLAPETRTNVENAISKFMATNNVPGISAAIVSNGAEVWSAGFGMSDLENYAPATEHTLYRLASISKSLTAIGAMQLSQNGKIDLDAPVQKYCPAFPQKQATITTRELLAHTAGIRHYRSNSPDDPELSNVKHFDDPIAGGLSFIANDPLVSEPGQEFHYSTFGYTVVGCVIEGASGQKYLAYMKDHVLVPAHMDSTEVDDQAKIIPLRTRFYAKDNSGRVVNAGFLDSSYKVPGGGWLSSADDMAKFEIAVLNDVMIKRSTRDVMWQPQKPPKSPDNTYALGWGWRSANSDGFTFKDVGHSGSQQGTSTSILIVPDRNVGVVVLCNLEEVDASELASTLMKIVLSAMPH